MRKINEIMPGVWEFEPQKLPEAELTERRLRHRAELEKWKEQTNGKSDTHSGRCQMAVEEQRDKRVL